MLDLPLSLVLRDLEKIEKGIRAGHIRENIAREFKHAPSVFEELFDIAKARIRNDKTKVSLIYRQSDLRFATPENVAEYRAKRLACGTLVDLCSGIGLQTIAFAKTCKRVIGIELDPRKVEYAKRNALLTKTENVEFICADALGQVALSHVRDAAPHTIFCDPQRPPTEQARQLASIEPSLQKLVSLYSPITQNLAIELPPQIEPSQIPMLGEKEYLSVDGKVNRLTFYMGDLAKSSCSVMSLPTQTRLASSTERRPFLESAPLRYLSEVDTAVIRANLLPELLMLLHKQDPQIALCYQESERCILTSMKPLRSALLRNSFEVKQITPNVEQSILAGLHQEKATQVMLRFKVEPNDYWRMRKIYEHGLPKSETKNIIHIFTNKDSAYLCQKI